MTNQSGKGIEVVLFFQFGPFCFRKKGGFAGLKWKLFTLQQDSMN